MTTARPAAHCCFGPATTSARASRTEFRALKRAYEIVGHPRMRVYDCRHAAATTWLRAGVPLRTVAMRLGHSVETLVSTYVGALEADEAIANERIDAALEVASVESCSHVA